MQCDHQMVRWCEDVGEFEPCALADVFEAYVDTLERYVEEIAEGRRRAPSAVQRYVPFWETEESRHVIIEDALNRVAQLPGVVETEEDQQTRVLWGLAPEAVAENLKAWTRRLEIEADAESD